MRTIQFENRYPDQLAISELRPDMQEVVNTPNGNVLQVVTNRSGISIADYAFRAPNGLPVYKFWAWIDRTDLLRAIICSRGPGDWPSRKHPDIRPTEQMKQAIDYFDRVDNPVDVFRANWTVDDSFHNTNALLFRQRMNDPALSGVEFFERQGIAAARTPTGKMMKLLGFVLDVESIIDHGHVIEADFSRGCTE